MREQKKVSVVVPNYNYARYLRKRLRSILRQTYPIYELIILDDASTDGSVEEALLTLERNGAELKERAEGGERLYEGECVQRGCGAKMRVRLAVSEANSGKAMRAWKKGWELVTGDYIWIAEADDLCSRRFLEEAMKGFDDPEVVLSYTESAIINGAGFMIAPNFRWSRDKERTGHYKRSYIKDGAEEIREIMAIRCTIPNVSSVVFKKEKKFLEYLEESLRFLQVGDWYFYVKVLRNGRIAYNRKALNKFRIHGGSVTAKSNAGRAGKHLAEIEEMHEMFRREYDLPEETMRRMEAEARRVEERMRKNRE